MNKMYINIQFSQPSLIGSISTEHAKLWQKKKVHVHVSFQGSTFAVVPDE